MKRRTSPLPVRVFAYGARPPRAQADEIDEQMRLGQKYRNKLLEIERKRRERYRAAMRECGDVAQLEAEIQELSHIIDSLRGQVNKQRAAARRRVEQPLMAGEIKQFRERRRVLVHKLRETKRSLKENTELQRTSARINNDAKAEIKAARASCGVYWGTYLLIEAAVEQARKNKIDPQFRKWTGAGRVGVQLQGGLSVAKLFEGNDTRFRMQPLPADTWSTRSGRRHAYSKVKLRIGSGDGKQPLFADLSVLMHRPLPADGVIKNVALKRRRIARRYYWDLLITVEAQSLEPARLPKSAPVAAVNFGWRVTDGGLLVATLVDEYGHVEQLKLPPGLLGRLDQAQSLQSIRMRNLEAWRGDFIDRLRRVAQPPEWLQESMKTIASWRSTDRFYQLALRIINEPAGTFEPGLVADADAWRKQDLHLLQWEQHSSERALFRRRDIYRQWAAKLSRRYSTVLFDDFDLRMVATLPQPEDEQNEMHGVQRRNRVRASISSLRMCIEHKVPTVKLGAARRTHVCHHCRRDQQFDAGLCVEHTCSECGATWDQDVNHAKNLLWDYAKTREE